MSVRKSNSSLSFVALFLFVASLLLTGQQGVESVTITQSTITGGTTSSVVVKTLLSTSTVLDFTSTYAVVVYETLTYPSTEVLESTRTIVSRYPLYDRFQTTTQPVLVTPTVTNYENAGTDSAQVETVTQSVALVTSTNILIDVKDRATGTVTGTSTTTFGSAVNVPSVTSLIEVVTSISVDVQTITETVTGGTTSSQKDSTIIVTATTLNETLIIEMHSLPTSSVTGAHLNTLTSETSRSVVLTYCVNESTVTSVGYYATADTITRCPVTTEIVLSTTTLLTTSQSVSQSTSTVTSTQSLVTSPTTSTITANPTATFWMANGNDRFLIYAHKVQFTQAEEVCALIGYSPARINLAKIGAAQNVLSLLIQNDFAWIGSYDGNNYFGEAKLAMNTSAVVVLPEVQSAYVICEKNDG